MSLNDIFSKISNIITQKYFFFKYLFIITLLKISFSFCDCIVMFYDLCIIILLIINNYVNGNEKDKNISQSMFYGISTFYLSNIISYVLLIILPFIPIIGYIIRIIIKIPYISNIINGGLWLLIIPHVYLLLDLMSLLINSSIIRSIFCILLIILYYYIFLPIFNEIKLIILN